MFESDLRSSSHTSGFRCLGYILASPNTFSAGVWMFLGFVFLVCWLLSCDSMVVLWFEWLRLVLRPFFLAGGRVYLGMLHPCRVTSNLLGIPWSLLVISGVIL